MKRGKTASPLRLRLHRVLSASGLGSPPASPRSPASPLSPASAGSRKSACEDAFAVCRSTPVSPAGSPLGPQRHSYSSGSLENLSLPSATTPKAAARGLPPLPLELPRPCTPCKVSSPGGSSDRSPSAMMSPQTQLKQAVTPRKWQSPVRFRPAPPRGMDAGYLGLLRVWRMASLLLHAGC